MFFFSFLLLHREVSFALLTAVLPKACNRLALPRRGAAEAPLRGRVPRKHPFGSRKGTAEEGVLPKALPETRSPLPLRGRVPRKHSVPTAEEGKKQG